MWNSQFEEARIHQQELRREAERSAIIRAFQAAHHSQPVVRPQLVVWFGGRLVAWGERLQGCCEHLSSEHLEPVSSVQR